MMRTEASEKVAKIAVLARMRSSLHSSLKPVPRGTNGAVSVAGLVFSLAGGLAIGTAYFVGVALSSPSLALGGGGGPLWRTQLPVVLLGGIAGLLGSLIDSILGAILQVRNYLMIFANAFRSAVQRILLKVGCVNKLKSTAGI